MYFDDEHRQDGVNDGSPPPELNHNGAQSNDFAQNTPQHDPQWSEPQHAAQHDPQWSEPQHTAQHDPQWAVRQPMAPPGLYYAQGEPTVRRRRRSVGRKVVAGLVVLALLLGATGAFVTFFEVIPVEGGLRISRRFIGDDTLYAPPTTKNSASPATPDVEPTQNPGGVENGPSLSIAPAQTTNTDTPLSGELTLQQVSAKCMPTAVGIVAMSDSYYYGTATSSGTGVIMSDEGYIITNNHVIDGAQSISVTLNDGREYEAQLIGKDKRSDLAVLKIEAQGITAAEFGDSDSLVVGDPVVAIGNPLGLAFMGTVTDGIVSAINRDVVIDERTMTVIQTNAAINSGNSGGPLFNMYGQVIGIVNSKMQSYSTTVEGLGFAIPTATVKEIVDELIQYGYVKGWPSIGMSYDDVTERMSQYYKIPRGVWVTYVNPSSNAYFAGLQVDDIIVEADGRETPDVGVLTRIKEEFKAGESFTIKVYRYATKTYHEMEFVLNDEAELSVLDNQRLIP